MAWIESHQSLSRHRKTMRAVAILGIDRHKLIGHLHELWWWALDNVPPDGHLGDLSDVEIAAAAQWDGDPGAFVAALSTAGFIDQTDNGRYLHDWWDYAGKLLEQRIKDRERKRAQCGWRGRDTHGGASPAVRRKSDGIPAEVRQNSGRTQPNPTQPNRTLPTTSTNNLPLMVQGASGETNRQADADAAGAPSQDGTERGAEPGTRNTRTAPAQKAQVARVLKAFERATGQVPTARDREVAGEMLGLISRSRHSVEQLCDLIREEADAFRPTPRHRYIRSLAYFLPAVRALAAGEYDGGEGEDYPDDLADERAAAARGPPG